MPSHLPFFTRHARLLLCWLAILLTTTAQANILLVKSGSTGGTRLTTVVAANWNTAAYATLRDALTTAHAGDQIWVAAGTYYPDQGTGATNNDRSMSFTMKEGVAIYGGFAGSETSLTNRNLALNVCILSGEIQQDNNPDNNSYHVIYNSLNNLTQAAVLDGFIIQEGAANEGDGDNSAGAGMFNYYSSPLLVNCIFRANQAGGAGCILAESSPSFINCTIQGNKGSYTIQIQQNSAPTFLNCSIAGNQGTAIILAANADPTFRNCIVWGNSSSIGINDADSQPTYEYSLLEGLNPGGTNLDGTKPTNNPLFYNLPDYNLAPTTSGNLRLNNCSPAIDAGYDNFNTTTLDIDNKPRKKDLIPTVTNTIDLGAYENQGSGYQFGPIFVNKATGNDFNTGNFWSNPLKTLKAALQVTCPRGQIWVVTGTYYPDQVATFDYNDRNDSFILKEGVSIYGGFPNQPTLPTMADRNWSLYPTILSGEIQQDNNPDNNSYHVIYNNSNGLTQAAVLDGFIIQEGAANEGDAENSAGAGMFNRNSSPLLINCIFRANLAVRGSGCLLTQSSSSFINCTFQGNKGSALQIQNDSAPTFLNCSIAGNQGSAIYLAYNADPTFRNCIVWGNSESVAILGNDCQPTYEYSLLEGLNPGGTNLDGSNAANNPLFVNLPDYSLAPTTSGDLQLQPCSPAINAGNNVIEMGQFDVAKQNRLDGGLVDLGAYEFQNAAASIITYPASAVATNPSRCTNGSIRLSDLPTNANVSVTYKKDNVLAAAVTYTTSSAGQLTLSDLEGGVYTEIKVRYGRCVYSVAGSVTLSFPTIIYVNQATGSDDNDGNSWNTAFKTLQKALAAACTNTQIWVATGTYYPDEGPSTTNNERSMSFAMKEGVKLYGGFAGNEATLTARNWATNVCILSGEIQQDNNLKNNSYHVIYNYGNGLTQAAVLDGFIIQEGYSNVSGNNNYGGGLFVNGSSPLIVNCIFRANRSLGGSATALSFSNTSFINCAFEGNTSPFSTLLIQQDSAPTFRNCSIAGNQGAAISLVMNADPTFRNCIVWGNSSSLDVYDSDQSIAIYHYSLIEGLNPGGTNLDGTNPTNNPLFVNLPDYSLAPTTSGDLSLQACSPVINAGNDSYNDTTTDLAGNNRKFGVIDLGAYEFQSNVNPRPTAIAGTTSGVVCVGADIKLTANGGSSFSWAGPSGSNFTSTAQNPVFVGTNTTFSGLYTVSVANANCANIATATVSVKVNAAPTMVVTPPAPQCGGTIDLNSVFSSDASLTFFKNTDFISAVANPVSSSGIYSATAVNDAGCKAKASVSVVINTSATVSVIPPPAQCGGTIQLSTAFNTNGSLSFFTDSGFSTTTESPVASSGVYYAKASVGTCTNSASVSVTIHPVPVASIDPTTAALCTGQSLTLSTNAGATGYSWARSAGAFTSATNQARFSSTIAGGFSISVTIGNSFSCTGSASASITVITQPTVSISPSTTQNVCQGQPLNLTASGSAPFSWTGPGFNTTNAIASLNTSSSSFSGVYKVTVGTSICTATATVSVNIQQAVLSVSPNPLTVCLGQTINLTANASPAASAFAWKGPVSFSSTTQTISTYATTTANLGIYSVSATIGSCTVSASTEVKSGAVLQAGVVGIPCLGGTIQFTATGMTSYSWSRPTNNFNSTLQNPVIPSSTMNDAGIYFLSARSGSCFVSMLVPVMIAGTGINPSFAVSPSSVAAGATVSLSAASATGVYSWSGPNGFSGNTRTKSISNFQSANNGTYRLTLTLGTCTGYTEKNISINSATRLAAAETEPIEMEINAYPNPVTHTLTVEVRLKEPAALQLNLVNSVGKDSGTWQLNEVSIFHKTELNLADLQGGVYLLQAQAGRQKVVKRVVKIQY
ncbi:MAG: choice-of-anchor Q domain-containing protein [Spirosomataceae bacterium]